MLEIKGISKVYRTGSLTQQALHDVSLNLRDNEFVAILGQSGSGKTTLLNIIGGLDRYDEGNLIINGVSTDRYSDRDWDSYRNHTVGFVFQSYNLIPHQSILQNVELALTISGISRAERTERARDALTRVGLLDHIHKKPSQLSGGQMQRVAIARALVNDPDILLADEPTGALDSETSVQVMDLLKEVAADRLVVMVTHNPELAQKYATRIVELHDGQILSDSDPYIIEDSAPSVHKNMGRSSMSFLTALSLSFNNLRTKKARTILVSFAGSIGIIGIALILSMSNGADKYIKSIEEDSLQDYPLQITDSSFSFASMYATALENASDTTPKGDVKELQTVTRMFTGVTMNDLGSLKDYFESGETDIYDNVQSIEYDYNMTPNIYRQNDDGSFRQVNPNTSFSALGFTSTGNMNGMLSTFSSTDSFFSLPENEERFRSDYELLYGEWPDSVDECLVVLSATGSVTDMTLYTLGLKDADELENMIQNFADGENTEVDATVHWYDYEDLLGIEFSVIPPSSIYTHDKTHGVWTSHADDEKFMKSLLSDSEKLRTVGVVKPSEDSNMSAVRTGIGYLSGLPFHLSDLAAKSPIVQAQRKDSDTNIFTGKRFDDEDTSPSLDMSTLFSVDKKSLQKAFNLGSGGDLSGFDLSSLDMSKLNFSDIDMSDVDMSSLDLSAMSGAFPSLSEDDLYSMFENLGVEISSEKMSALFEELLTGYLDYASSDPSTDYTALPQAIGQYLSSEDARQILYDQFRRILDENSSSAITADELQDMVEHILSGYPAYLEENDLVDDGTLRYLSDYLSTGTARTLISESVATLRERLHSLLPTDKQLSALANALIEGYEAYAQENALPMPSKLLSSFTDYLSSDKVQQKISDEVFGTLNEDAILSAFGSFTDTMNAGISAMMRQVVRSLTAAVTDSLSKTLSSFVPSMSAGLQDLFRFDTNSLADAFRMNLSAEELSNLMTSLLKPETSSYEANLKKLGYIDRSRPTTITIYPNNYDAKTRVKEIIDEYNQNRQKAGEDDKVITYTDMVDALMGSVTDIVNAISYVLIAFVAISLVVSSIMIGVITYISVLERKKEIGILRAIGASKRNISEVFNAETFIIGFLAGLFGVGITSLLLLPINAILHALVPQADIRAILPPTAAVILVVLSIILTLIGGIIPSRKASHSDPVLALRSE